MSMIEKTLRYLIFIVAVMLSLVIIYNFLEANMTTVNEPRADLSSGCDGATVLEPRTDLSSGFDGQMYRPGVLDAFDDLIQKLHEEGELQLYDPRV